MDSSKSDGPFPVLEKNISTFRAFLMSLQQVVYWLFFEICQKWLYHPVKKTKLVGMEPIDLSFKNKRAPKIGTVLISDPFLDEDFFRRSVVLLCNHNKDGSFGLVLNNYLNVDLHELEDSFPDIKARISVGGPVDTEHLFFIHSYGTQIEGSTPILDELYFGGDYEKLVELLKDDEDGKSKVRFFLGYSGWGKDQLKDELTENSWIVANNITETEILNTADDQLWKHCLEKQGKRFETISKFPLNPSEN